MGYGFVEFGAPSDAREALRKMNGTRLHDHVLQLQLSSRRAATPAAGAKAKVKPAQHGGGAAAGGGGGADGAGGGGGATSDGAATSAGAATAGGAAKRKPSEKLIVRNLPFQANAKEVRELFSAFGQLKTVRLPKKFDGTHRGFAFVEFSSKGEAGKAMESLHSTHLYGRHLVLEYAEEERSVEGLREKLRAQMAQAGEAADDEARRASKKRRKTGGTDGGGGVDDLQL